MPDPLVFLEGVIEIGGIPSGHLLGTVVSEEANQLVVDHDDFSVPGHHDSRAGLLEEGPNDRRRLPLADFEIDPVEGGGKGSGDLGKNVAEFGSEEARTAVMDRENAPDLPSAKERKE